MKNSPAFLRADAPSRQAAAMPSDLKLKNRMLILDVFRRGGEYTAADVASMTGISRQTVMKAVQFFYEKGLLAAAGKGESTEIGGKKPMLFSFHSDKYLICITMWPGLLGISLLNMWAEQIDRVERTLDLPGDAKGMIGLIGGQIRELLRRNGIGDERLYGVALSTAGTVNYRENKLKYSSLTPEWGTNVPLADYLREYVGESPLIFIENAGKMTGSALLLEKGIDAKRVMTLFTTWGVSACLIDKGHILSGKDSLIGEIGHMEVDPEDTEVCGCGSCGCLERLVSIERLRRMIELGIRSRPESLLAAGPVGEITIRDIFAASAAGDSYARELSAYMARLWALAIRNISLVFNPDLVVFQGNFAFCDEYFDRTLREVFSSFRYYPRNGSFGIRYDRRELSELDVLGASRSLLSRFFKDPALYV